MSQHSEELLQDPPPSGVAKAKFFHILAATTPARAPTAVESKNICNLLHTRAMAFLQETGMPDGTLLVSSNSVLGHLMAVLHPRLSPQATSTIMEPLTLDGIVFHALPALDLETPSLAIWFSIADLASSERFLPPSGSAETAPAVAKAIAQKMGGSIAFWTRTGVQPDPSHYSVAFGRVGIRFACLVPTTATLVKGTFQGMEVEYEKHASFKACAHCHSLAHKRPACPSAPLCPKCKSTTAHGPTFCNLPAAPVPTVPQPTPVSPETDGWQQASSHSRLNGRTDKRAQQAKAAQKQDGKVKKAKHREREKRRRDKKKGKKSTAESDTPLASGEPTPLPTVVESAQLATQQGQCRPNSDAPAAAPAALAVEPTPQAGRLSTPPPSTTAQPTTIALESVDHPVAIPEHEAPQTPTRHPRVASKAGRVKTHDLLEQWEAVNNSADSLYEPSEGEDCSANTTVEDV